MPAYMLDTATVSFALRGQGRVAARLLEHRPSEICISSITPAELRYRAEARRSPKLNRLIQHVRGVHRSDVLRVPQRILEARSDRGYNTSIAPTACCHG
jgi:predicted nucleic acid-binding protein